MSSDYQASVLYIKIARQHAAAQNIDLPDLLAGSSLQQATKQDLQDNKKLPLKQVLDYWEQAAKTCSDNAFGLHAGQHCHLTSYGIFSHLLMNCATIYDGMQLIDKYSFMMNEALVSTSKTEQGITTYALDYLFPHSASYHQVEFHFASMVQLGKQIVARKEKDRVTPLRVEFSHPPAAAMAEYQHIFGCDTLFEQKANRIIFSYETLLLASNAPNKGLYEHLLKQVDSIYQADISQKRYSYKVNEYLRSEKEWQHWPSLDETANALGVSVSTLKRKLKQEGSSYQEISDRIRYQRAQRMLSSPKHTVSEVAYRLGFSCSASFGHSFKRWSGMSPTEYTN